MNRKFFIFLLSFLLAHAPLAFAPQGHDLDSEAQDEGRQSPALLAKSDASNVEGESLQVPTANPDNPASEEICRLLAMPVHLRNILQFLTFEQLKACKGVSKEWYRAATYALSLKPRFRLQLPPLLTPPLPPCTGVSCETTVVAVPDPTAEAAATPQATPEDTHEDTSEVAPPADRDRVSLFLENLRRGTSRHAWATPCNRLSVTFNKSGALFLEKLRPAAIILTLPQNTPLPVPNFQHVRHLYLNDQHVPTTFFAFLAQAPLETLDLSDVRLIKAGEADPSFYQAIFQLRHLTDLKDLNLAHLKAMDGWPLGEAIWQETCQKLGLNEHADLLPTHIKALTDNNPISYLGNLEKLNLDWAALDLHLNFLQKCAPRLRVLELELCDFYSFEGLNACVNLRVLYAHSNPVTPSEVWRHMTNLRQLRVLNVFNIQGIHQYDEATRATCMQVLSQNTHLTSLILMGHGIGPEGAAALEGLIRLEKLDLQFCGIGDAGFQKLPLSNMKELDVPNNRLTHESMRHLRQILDQISRPCLRHLTLSSNPLDDEAVAYLAPMTYLKRLDLLNTNATAEGMQVLAPLMPHLDVLVCEDT